MSALQKRILNVIVGTLSFVGPIGFLAATWYPALIPLEEELLSYECFDTLRLIFGSVSLVLVLASILSCSSVVPAGKRGLWVVVLLLANVIALPFFWFWYINPRLDETPGRWKADLAGAGIIAALIAALSFAAYRSADKAVVSAEVTGVLQSTFQTQSRDGDVSTVYFVLLDSGELVSVTAPQGNPFRKDARVVLVRSEAQGSVAFTFGRYDR